MLERDTRLGPYEVVALLGRGRMGEVYRARDARLGRDIAIKVLASAPDAQHLHRFEYEARAAAALSHLNILAIYDVGIHEGQPYVASELRVGGAWVQERGLRCLRMPLMLPIVLGIRRWEQVPVPLGCLSP